MTHIDGEEYAGVRDRVRAGYSKLRDEGMLLSEEEFNSNVDRMDRITLVSIYETYLRGGD